MEFLIHHMLRKAANQVPEKEALVHKGERLSYQDVARHVRALARGLRRAGALRGDRIGIYLDPSMPQVLSIFAISQAGGVFVPINQLLFPDQVAHIANDCGVRGLVTTATKLATLEPILGNIPSLEFIVVVQDGNLPDTPVPLHSFAELCALDTSDPDLGPDVNVEKDLAAILYTSGSTGKPKGVMLSHAQIMAGASIVSTYLEIQHSERILAVLPFSFDAGLNQLMTAFQQGATLVLTTFVFAKEIVDALLRERITGLAGVPTLWSLLAQPSSTLQKHMFHDLRYITNTGGRMPENVLKVLRGALPTTKVFLMYGLTEAFRSTYLPPEELDRRPTSMGKAIPNTEILVINDQGTLCAPGDVGELVHRGPTVSMGYWGKPELTEKVLRPHPLLPPEIGKGEKVCYSGDLVKADEAGFLYFVGRRDNMIKSCGFRISPSEIEQALFQTGQLREAAVIGIPDDVLGQAIKAFAAPLDGITVAPESLLSFCAEKLPRYMVPKTLEVLNELPKTPTGKIDYPALHRREAAQP